MLPIGSNCKKRVDVDINGNVEDNEVPLNP